MKEVYISGAHSGFIGGKFAEDIELHHPTFKVVKGDREGSCHNWPYIILDFASYGNYHNQKDVAKVYEANVIRLLHLLQHTNHIEYKAFIVTGTSSEYGKADIPMHEALLPKPDSFYAAAKTAGINLAQTWARLQDKPIVCIRPFSVTGPGEQGNHLIPTLIRGCMEGLEVPLVPHPVHDFIDIRDFISGVWRIVDRAKDLKGEIINIGSGKQYTNQEVLEMVEKATHKKAAVRTVDGMRDYDKKLWVADNFRLKSLGWEPKFTLQDSINDMVKEYVEQRKTN